MFVNFTRFLVNEIKIEIKIIRITGTQSQYQKCKTLKNNVKYVKRSCMKERERERKREKKERERKCDHN